MPHTFWWNPFYRLLGFRILSRMTSGARKKKYKEKYEASKKELSSAAKERISLFGLHLFDIITYRKLKAYSFLTVPVLVTSESTAGYNIRLLGIEVYRKMNGSGAGKSIEFTDMSLAAKEIYAKLKKAEGKTGNT